MDQDRGNSGIGGYGGSNGRNRRGCIAGDRLGWLGGNGRLRCLTCGHRLGFRDGGDQFVWFASSDGGGNDGGSDRLGGLDGGDRLAGLDGGGSSDGDGRCRHGGLQLVTPARNLGHKCGLFSACRLLFGYFRPLALQIMVFAIGAHFGC